MRFLGCEIHIPWYSIHPGRLLPKKAETLRAWVGADRSAPPEWNPQSTQNTVQSPPTRHDAGRQTPESLRQPVIPPTNQGNPSDLSEAPSWAKPQGNPSVLSEPPSWTKPQGNPSDLSEAPSWARPQGNPSDLSEPPSGAKPQESPMDLGKTPIWATSLFSIGSPSDSEPKWLEASKLY
jgi:hypothetical protein